MLLKSIVVASAAASLAPILGASLFFGINAFQCVSPTVTGKTAPYQVGFGSWRTTIYCADGQPILKHEDCDRLKSIDVAKNSELAVVD
jgi:hypothetical protein